MDIKNINNVLKQLDINNLYCYNAEVTLTNNSDITKTTLQLDTTDFYCIVPYITITDSAGRVIDNDTLKRNKFSVNLFIDGKQFADRDDIPFSLYNRAISTPHFRGFTLRAQQELSFEVTVGGDYAGHDYPIKAKLSLMGYNLGGQPNFKSIRDLADLSTPFSYAKNYTITSSTDSTETQGIDNKIKIGDDPLLCYNAYIDVIDDDGNVVDWNGISNQFTVTMRDNKSNIIFTGLPIKAFNLLSQSLLFRYIFFKRYSEYKIDIVGGTFPDSTTSQKLSYDALTEPFIIGDTLTGGTSSATGTIENIDNSGATGTLLLTGVSGTFQDNETITGAVVGSATSDGAGVSGELNNYPLDFQITFQGYKLNKGV